MEFNLLYGVLRNSLVVFRSERSESKATFLFQNHVLDYPVRDVSFMIFMITW